ncbi:energy-coupling factor transporter transmembrane component T family protein [Cochlodiniinecator piscidefendens]|uniref:energy-coupling factor transporter transmembrane component T family protein n=1 Tax=Cochlodiniinecator piscidefendens TaxID=2715756 RepID=UPI00140E3631|nr:energy-coupling factor transporter transmembrane component T [Cochlodiniinecator piscidefendens]
MISLTSPIKTPFHKIPAGVKLGLLSLFTASLFLSETLTMHVGAVALTVAFYLIGGVAFAKSGFKMLKPLWPFLAIIMLWHVVTDTTPAGVLITLKLVAAVGMANLVTMTTRLDEMIVVLEWLMTPLRKLGVRTGAVSIAIALVVRFTPVLAQKATYLGQSWKARSPKRAGWRIVAPFALLAIDDAEHVAEALRARGGIRDETGA